MKQSKLKNMSNLWHSDISKLLGILVIGDQTSINLKLHSVVLFSVIGTVSLKLDL